MFIMSQNGRNVIQVRCNDRSRGQQGSEAVSEEAF